MMASDSAQRLPYRLASRRVLQTPALGAAHQTRTQAALALPGAEPLQAALVDWLHGCADQATDLGAALRQNAVRERLPPFVWQALVQQWQSGQALPRISPWATRWCVLVTPSSDVPERALLCGIDDSHSVVQAFMPQLLAGDAQAEQDFLKHCVGAHDTLAFMLARRQLQKAGRTLGPAWAGSMQALQEGS